MAAIDSALSATAYLSDIRVWTAELKTAGRRWLRNFDDKDQDDAAALLDAFVFFSDEFVDRLFIAAFDALAVEVTRNSVTYDDKKAQWQAFKDQVLITHPTGEMPNVTDSGYAFDRRARQMLSIDQAHILDPALVVSRLRSGPPVPVVFVDDFVGSGDQFKKTWQREFDTATGKASFASIAASGGVGPFFYCPLVCTQHGRAVIQTDCKELEVRPTHLLPEESSANHADSLLWPDALRAQAAKFIEDNSVKAGIAANKCWGYAGLGLALAFEHGVPDSTLPIIWWEENGWVPLVRRR
jgi:hypothetical protein